MSTGSKMSSRQRQYRMEILHDIQKGICPYCTVEILHPTQARAENAMSEGWAPSLEHVIPRCRRGGDELENLLLVHKDCNEDRGDGNMPHWAMKVWREVRTRVAKMRRDGLLQTD